MNTVYNSANKLFIEYHAFPEVPAMNIVHLCLVAQQVWISVCGSQGRLCYNACSPEDKTSYTICSLSLLLSSRMLVEVLLQTLTLKRCTTLSSSCEVRSYRNYMYSTHNLCSSTPYHITQHILVHTQQVLCLVNHWTLP